MSPNIHARDRAPALKLLMTMLLVSLSASSCSSVPLPGFGPSEEEIRRAQELSSLLDRYTRFFSVTVENAADEIADASTDLTVRRASVQWKLMMIPRIKELSRSRRKGEALMGVWLYTQYMSNAIESRSGAQDFGSAQQIAIDAARRLTVEITNIARQVLDNEENFEAAQAYITEIAAVGKIDPIDTDLPQHMTVETAVRELADQDGNINWLPEFSLESINPFSGLNESAQAIRDFTLKTTTLVDDLTTEVPWQIELLLYDIEGRQMVTDTQATFESVSQSADLIARTAADWPTDIESVIKSTLAGLDEEQVGLRQTLEQTLEALVEARSLVKGLSETADHLSAAGTAWQGTFEALGLDDEDDDDEETKDPNARPFDILDYRDTASEIRSLALELRGLIDDIDRVTGQKGEDAPIHNLEVATRATVAAAVDQGQELIDHASWRLLQVIAVALLAAIGYRIFSYRLGKRADRES